MTDCYKNLQKKKKIVVLSKMWIFVRIYYFLKMKLCGGFLVQSKQKKCQDGFVWYNVEKPN